MKRILFLILIFISCSTQQQINNETEIVFNSYYEESIYLKEKYKNITEYDAQLTNIQKKYDLSPDLIEITKNDLSIDLVDKNNYEILCTNDATTDLTDMPINYIYREILIGRGELITIELKNLKGNNPDTRMFLIEGELNSNNFKNISYNDDYNYLPSSKIESVLLGKDKIYTLIIHSYDASTSGTCDIYINDILYKENISFGGQTIYRTFGNLDIFRAKSENMVTDSFLIIAGYNEAEKSYKILYYSDDSDVDLSFNFQIKDAVYTKGYLLFGAYSPSSEGYIDLKLIKGGSLDAIPNE